MHTECYGNFGLSKNFSVASPVSLGIYFPCLIGKFPRRLPYLAFS